MKTNTPVTQNEIFLPTGRYIVSKTDLKGLITEVNETFIEVSGFSRDELIGQSHNIVRHPDMPPSAFEDLWRTLESGRAWRGIVKNRCKNGDFYWVDAFAVPVRKGGQVIGYMSVRTAPARDTIKSAEMLYEQLRHSKKSIPPPARRLGIVQRMYLMAALTMLLLVGGAAVGTLGFYQQYPAIAFSGLAISLVVTAIGWWLVSRSIVQPFASLIKHLGRISEGRLTDDIDISRTDEIGELYVSLAIMQTNLKIMLDNVLQTSLAVDSHSRQLEQEMAELVAHSLLQHQETDEVTRTMKEISLAAGAVASSAALAADAATSAQNVVEDSGARMDQNMVASQQVVNAVHTSNSSMTELFQSIFRIGEIAKLIKEIADQTNLLALNAAIEAARAGEQGRGFAVVADEVRKLAERTSASTVDINDTVQKIQIGTRSAIDSMENAVSEVNLSTTLMQGASEGFQQISSKSAVVTDMAQEIAAASEEQSAATETVAANIDHIAALVEQNTGIAQEASQVADELTMISTRLRQLISEFELIRT